MSQEVEFNFSGNNVANTYDSYLVPILFDPWAQHLIREHGPWKGQHILDLATGTGIVASCLASNIGQNGRVTGMDINDKMLAVAKKRCEQHSSRIQFIQGSASALPLPDKSVNRVICQQGFQFFPDKNDSALEMKRVLKAEGSVIITTWRPVEECQFFGAICNALESIDENEISAFMRLPFDHLQESALYAPFEKAGFINIQVKSQKKSLIVKGGITKAIELAYATPIGPKLRSLTSDKQKEFCNYLEQNIEAISNGEDDMGWMVSNVLTAN